MLNNYFMFKTFYEIYFYFILFIVNGIISLVEFQSKNVLGN